MRFIRNYSQPQLRGWPVKVLPLLPPSWNERDINYKLLSLFQQYSDFESKCLTLLHPVRLCNIEISEVRILLSLHASLKVSASSLLFLLICKYCNWLGWVEFLVRTVLKERCLWTLLYSHLYLGLLFSDVSGSWPHATGIQTLQDLRHADSPTGVGAFGAVQLRHTSIGASRLDSWFTEHHRITDWIHSERGTRDIGFLFASL